ncbi:TRAP transporter substrate-binding protein [Neobacillus vireti]|uniref:TRAP transporter substrate-binding protein n=1 Tax=Neobacillus vireti TaxID=220686 RepID=UPI002FFFBB85
MLKKKLLMMFCLFFLLVVLIAGCGSNSENTSRQENNNDDNSETITLKLATSTPTTHPFGQYLIDPFMKRVTELTNGQVQFKYYPGEQLGKGQDLLDLMSDGVTDIAYISSPYYPDKMPIASTLLGMPGLLDSSYQASMAFHSLSKQDPVLQTDFLRNGVRPVATFVTPAYGFFTKDKLEIKVPEDLSGLKVRAVGGAVTEALEFAGATPVNIAATEMYEAFEKGIVDVQFAYHLSMKGYGLDELIDYATKGVPFGAGGVGLAINENVWKKLPENVKEAITQAGDEVTASNAKIQDEQNKEVIEQWKSNGVKIHQVTENEKKQWQELFDKFNKQWLEKQNNEDIMKVFEKYLDEGGKYK